MRRKNLDTLEGCREVIERERCYVDRKPYSHNIVSLTLSKISSTWGVEEVNRAIDDFDLEELGWHKQ